MSTENAALSYVVCYADTDAGGIVYHGRFLEMAERSLNKMLNAVGCGYKQLAEQHRAMLVIRRVEVSYIAPAVLEDHLRMRTRLSKCMPSRSVWITDVTRGDTLLAQVKVEAVMVDVATRQLMQHPDAFIDRLEAYLVDHVGA